ncbi:unnamed protein product, partial [Rotaria sp. Silwood1]
KQPLEVAELMMSKMKVDYFVASARGDSFESALCLLRDQVRAVCFDKYKQLFVQIYSRPHAVFTILS